MVCVFIRFIKTDPLKIYRYFTVLCCFVLYCTTVLYSTVLYCTTALYGTVLYYSTLLHCTALHCTDPWPVNPIRLKNEIPSAESAARAAIFVQSSSSIVPISNEKTNNNKNIYTMYITKRDISTASTEWAYHMNRFCFACVRFCSFLFVCVRFCSVLFVFMRFCSFLFVCFVCVRFCSFFFRLCPFVSVFVRFCGDR